MAKSKNVAPATQQSKTVSTTITREKKNAAKAGSKALSRAKSKAANAPDPKTPEEIKARIEDLIGLYEEASLFNEVAKMNKYLDEAKELVGKYNADAEAKAFEIIKRADNMMVALAEMKTYSGIGVKTATDKDTKRSKMVMIPVDKVLDPLRLNNRVKGGIGADHKWPAMVGRLWDNIIAVNARRCGIDPKTVRDTIYVGEADRLYKLHSEDESFGEEMIRGCMQEVLDAMLGEGYEARMDLVGKVMCETGKTARDVAKNSSVSPDAFRKAFVGVLYLTVTGKSVEQDIKSRKR